MAAEELKWMKFRIFRLWRKRNDVLLPSDHRMATWWPSSWRTAASTWASGWAWPRLAWRPRSSTSTCGWRPWSTASPSPTPRLWCLAQSSATVRESEREWELSAAVAADGSAKWWQADRKQHWWVSEEASRLHHSAELQVVEWWRGEVMMLQKWGGRDGGCCVVSSHSARIDTKSHSHWTLKLIS